MRFAIKPDLCFQHTVNPIYASKDMVSIYSLSAGTDVHMCVLVNAEAGLVVFSTHLGLGSPSFPDVRADGLHDTLAHLDGSFGGLIPSPHLLGMVGNLGNLDNLLQEDGGLLEDELEVILQAVRDFSTAQVSQQQHVDFLDSCLAVPEEGLVLQSPDGLCKLSVKSLDIFPKAGMVSVQSRRDTACQAGMDCSGPFWQELWVQMRDFPCGALTCHAQDKA